MRTVERLCTQFYKSDKRKCGEWVNEWEILVAYRGKPLQILLWVNCHGTDKPNKLFLPPPNPLAATWLDFKCNLKYVIMHYNLFIYFFLNPDSFRTFLLRNSFHIKSVVKVRIKPWPWNGDIWLPTDHQSKQAKWMIWAAKRRREK